MTDEDIQQLNQEVLRSMIWVNTNLLVFLVFIAMNIVAWLFIDKLIYRAASFLVISLVSLFYWDRWRREIGELLNE